MFKRLKKHKSLPNVNICMIEVYLLKYYFESTSYINNAIIDKQSSIN